ncbi:MAG: HD family phosphohydrolase [Omnitrophica WOR_2 bacterium]|jgi:putative nucleotidyltransferase with HDIG domain
MRKSLIWLRNNYNLLEKITLFMLVIWMLILVFPREGKFKYEYQRGKPWQHNDLIAPVDFAVLKPTDELKKEQEIALEQLRPHFTRNNAISDAQVNLAVNDFNNHWNKEMIQTKDDDKVKSLNLVLSILDTLFTRGIVSLTSEIDDKPTDYQVWIIDGNTAAKIPLARLFTIQSAEKYIRKQVDESSIKNKNLVYMVLINALKQNIVYDKEATLRARENILAEIPDTRGMVQRGERIISHGELVNAEKFQVLESLRTDYEGRLGSTFKYFNILVGQALLISLTMIAFILFMLSFRKDLFAENKKLLLMLILILIMVSVASLTIRLNSQLLQLLPFCLVPIIIRVFFDTRLAYFVHVVTLILTGFMVPNAFEFIFMQLIAGIIAIISVAELRRRSQFFITAAAIFSSYSAIYIGMLLIQDGSFENIEQRPFILFAGNALFTLFSYPLIFLFEKTFGLVTDVTLMELSDTNSPLLRKLSQYAPGTFQHSLQVANIAEEAVYAIGGNTLLVRVGALYHDIGKMDMPMYFIENQTSAMNPHDELGYEDSGRIIIGHVHKGIELAKKYKLPEVLVDFIRTHHGTRRAEYFYNLKKIEFPEEEISDKPFKYPGPVPFSKETSVLMMADSVEAASRSMHRPTADSISQLVERIIDTQVNDNQFSNSDLTFQDITRIKKILKKRLMSIYHIRIEYPVL